MSEKELQLVLLIERLLLDNEVLIVMCNLFRNVMNIIYIIQMDRNTTLMSLVFVQFVNVNALFLYES